MVLAAPKWRRTWRPPYGPHASHRETRDCCSPTPLVAGLLHACLAGAAVCAENCCRLLLFCFAGLCGLPPWRPCLHSPPAPFPCVCLPVSAAVASFLPCCMAQSFTGARHGGDHLLDLLKGLEANGLTASYTHLLTGYIGSASLLEAVVEVVGALRRVSPGLTYVCDPVMGDEGRLYVAQDMVDSYRQHIVPLASVMTPNQYEAELLTGIKINGTADALRACEELHARGPHTVVITSMASSARPGHIQLVASTMRAQASAAAADGGSRQAPHKQVVMFIPQIPAYFTGTGT